MPFTLNNVHVRMKKVAMFQQNYMIVLGTADNLGVNVLLVLRVLGHPNINLRIRHKTA